MSQFHFSFRGANSRHMWSRLHKCIFRTQNDCLIHQVCLHKVLLLRNVLAFYTTRMDHHLIFSWYFPKSLFLPYLKYRQNLLAQFWNLISLDQSSFNHHLTSVQDAKYFYELYSKLNSMIYHFKLEKSTKILY